MKTTKYHHQQKFTQANSTGGIKYQQKQSDTRWMYKVRKECYANKMWEKIFYKIQYSGLIKIFGKQRLHEKFFNLLSNFPNTHQTSAKITLKG